MNGLSAVVSMIARAVPLKAWLALLLVSGAAGGVWWGHAQWEALRARDFERGRLHERQVSQLDSLWRANLARQQRAAEQRTDSVRRTTQRARVALTQAIDALPPAMATLPPVQLVVSSATQVARESEALAAAFDVERAVMRMRAASDSALIVTQRIVIGQWQDSVRVVARERDRRPTRTQAVGLAVLGLFVGVVTGRSTGAH